MSTITVVLPKHSSPLAVQIAAAIKGMAIEFVDDESSKDVQIQGTEAVGDTKCSSYLCANEDVGKAIELAEKAKTSLDSFLSELNSLLNSSPSITPGGAGASDAIVFAVLLEMNFEVKQCGRQNNLVAKWFQSFKHNAQLKALLAAPKKPNAQKSLMGTQGKRTLTGYEEGMKVVTRFAPEPSGYLHIGHIKACLLCDFFAREYNGEMILRFDDTNPAKEKQEFVDSITADLKTLGVSFAKLTFTSDSFDWLLEQAKRFIEEGNAYVETQSKEDMKAQKMEFKPSVCRDQPKELNLKLFQEMINGTEEGRKYVLRAKIDYASKNGVLRDPSIYRCMSGEHYRTGKKYNVYPLYDFSTPLLDARDGVTHALRSAEYHDRNALYNWMIEAAKVRKVVIEDFSRLNFAYVLLSKRKLQWFVDKKLVEGWNDPRFPTLQGMLRRGLTVEAMREFCIAQGASKADNLMEMDKIWAVNKKLIDPIVPRYTAIEKNGHFILKVSDFKAPYTKIELRHKRNADLGKKAITISPEMIIEEQDALSVKVGEEITLMDIGNVFIDSIDLENRIIVSHSNIGGSVKNTKKLTWLPTSDFIDVTIVEYDHLITAKKLDEKMKFEDFVNPITRATTDMIGDPNLRTLAKGDKIQLERRGYFIVDQPYLSGHGMVLVLIPDGDKTPGFKRKINIKW